MIVFRTKQCIIRIINRITYRSITYKMQNDQSSLNDYWSNSQLIGIF